MIGIKIGLIGLVLVIIGYLAFPEHIKKGVGHLKYPLNGLVISIISFLLLILEAFAKP